MVSVEVGAGQSEREISPRGTPAPASVQPHSNCKSNMINVACPAEQAVRPSMARAVYKVCFRCKSACTAKRRQHFTHRTARRETHGIEVDTCHHVTRAVPSPNPRKAHRCLGNCLRASKTSIKIQLHLASPCAVHVLLSTTRDSQRLCTIVCPTRLIFPSGVYVGPHVVRCDPLGDASIPALSHFDLAAVRRPVGSARACR